MVSSLAPDGNECACTRTRGGKERVCAQAQSNARARGCECARICAARVRARAPVDAGADGIDNNLSIPLSKQVDALVEMQQHW